MRIKLTVVSTFVVTLVFAAIIYFRVVDKPYGAPFTDVLVWQSVVWLPWLLFGYVIGRLDHHFPIAEQTVGVWVLRHMMACLLIVTLHTPWFFEVSRTISPFLGAEDTGYGVFRFFFILWAGFDVLFYWTLLGVFAFIQLRSVMPRATSVDTETKPSHSDYFFVKSKGQQISIKIHEIEWIEAEDYCCRIHIRDQSYLMRRSLKSFEASLPEDQFTRIHRSTIVNINFVASIDTGDSKRYIIQMKNGVQRPVSSHGRVRLKQILS